MADHKLEDWLPMSPLVGPPLPKFLSIYWPWYKEEGSYTFYLKEPPSNYGTHWRTTLSFSGIDVASNNVLYEEPIIFNWYDVLKKVKYPDPKAQEASFTQITWQFFDDAGAEMALTKVHVSSISLKINLTGALFWQTMHFDSNIPKK